MVLCTFDLDWIGLIDCRYVVVTGAVKAMLSCNKSSHQHNTSARLRRLRYELESPRPCLGGGGAGAGGPLSAAAVGLAADSNVHRRPDDPTRPAAAAVELDRMLVRY